MLTQWAWLGAVLGLLGALLGTLNGPCLRCRFGCFLVGGLLTLPYCVALHAGPAIVQVIVMTFAGALGLGRLWAAGSVWAVASRARRRRGLRGWWGRRFRSRAGQVHIPLDARKHSPWS